MISNKKLIKKQSAADYNFLFLSLQCMQEYSLLRASHTRFSALSDSVKSLQKRDRDRDRDRQTETERQRDRDRYVETQRGRHGGRQSGRDGESERKTKKDRLTYRLTEKTERGADKK